MNRKIVAVASSFVGIAALAGCGSQADVASKNLSTAAEQFQINRRVVVQNAITDKYILAVEGLCSTEFDEVKSQLAITCKAGPSEYKKHFARMSDNVTYFVEQLQPAKVNTYHYKVIFRPESIVPDIDFDATGSPDQADALGAYEGSK